MVEGQVQKHGNSVLDWDASIGHMAVYKVIIFSTFFILFALVVPRLTGDRRELNTMNV